MGCGFLFVFFQLEHVGRFLERGRWFLSLFSGYDFVFGCFAWLGHQTVTTIWVFVLLRGHWELPAFYCDKEEDESAWVGIESGALHRWVYQQKYTFQHLLQSCGQ